MKDFQFQPTNAHRVAVDGQEMLFHVPTTSLFALDAMDRAVLDFAAGRGEGFTRSELEHAVDPADAEAATAASG